jgi:hypothetical protein
MALFKWETLKEVGQDNLQSKGALVPGKMYEIELTSGRIIRVWRADDGQQYFCHGLTFGGKEAPDGAISPYTGWSVETILREHYQMIPEGEARGSDILVWHGLAPETTPHSAILIDPVIVQGRGYLDEATMLQTKNGLSPETIMSLGTLIERFYGESYNAYHRIEMATRTG